MIQLAERNAEYVSTITKLEAQLDALAAENSVRGEFIAHCFRVAADGGTLDGGDIQELGERLGLFGRETYQPVLHGYICGHEAGEDTVYVMKKKPATDAFLREVRAQGLDMAACALDDVNQYNYANMLDDLAQKLRQGGAQSTTDEIPLTVERELLIALRKGGAA